MPIYESIASRLIGSPLQGLAESMRRIGSFPKRWKHPELREIYLEDARSQQLIHQAVKDGMNCIDAGCHLGSVLQKFVRQSPSGRHIAVEPLPYKAAWLRQKYPTVDIHQVALGNREETLEFFYDRRRSGYSGLRNHGKDRDVDRFQVQCRRLDDIVPADLPIHFLKVDVEGGEYQVFLGARRILTESRPLLYFECTRSGLASFGTASEQVFAHLTEELRYRIYLLKDYLNHGQPLNFSEFQTSMTYPFQAFNFVAAPLPTVD